MNMKKLDGSGFLVFTRLFYADVLYFKIILSCQSTLN